MGKPKKSQRDPTVVFVGSHSGIGSANVPSTPPDIKSSQSSHKIRIYSLSHDATNKYGGCYIQFVEGSTQLGSLFYFGASPDPVIYLDACLS